MLIQKINLTTRQDTLRNSADAVLPLKKSLAKRTYIADGDDIIYSLKFISEKEVIVSIFEFGVFQQSYTLVNDIVDIQLLKEPLQYRIKSENELELIKSPHTNAKGRIMKLTSKSD